MNNPYSQLPKYTKWNYSVSNSSFDKVDPIVSFPFKIKRGDRIATAGSCFAQHIAKNLVKSGFNYYIAELPHPIIEPFALDFGYGTFSARYGNIYSSRHLLQLIQRSFDLFKSIDDGWIGKGGEILDPFRPNIQPGGFISKQELLQDQKIHLEATRTMFLNLDYFIFTLGLTECWINKTDGTVYPICPGIYGGEFNPQLHQFVNLGSEDVTHDLMEFYSLLKEVNPKAKLILTVSPVPLAATAENRHILISNSLSKSVLRVAAENMMRHDSSVAYFPSYEIISSSYNCGQYYEKNMRDVSAEGVSKVMNLFFKHATLDQANYDGEINRIGTDSSKNNESLLKALAASLKIECDDEMLGHQ